MFFAMVYVFFKNNAIIFFVHLKAVTSAQVMGVVKKNDTLDFWTPGFAG